MARFSISKKGLTFKVIGTLISLIVAGYVVYVLWFLGNRLYTALSTQNIESSDIIRFELQKAEELGM